MSQPRPHGYARYKLDRCRCNTCGWAVAEYSRRRAAAIAAGTWRADADQVRAHLRKLMSAGMGRRRICEVTGVGDSTLVRILHGGPGRPPPVSTRRDIADRIFALEVDVAPGALVDSAGTVRRVQALVAIGWTLTEIAAEAGWTVGNLSGLVSAGERVTAGTARAFAAVYDRWSMTPRTGASADRARRFAARRGWLPPLAWDDDRIDDPAAVARPGRARPGGGS